jgi:hypothetical protein
MYLLEEYISFRLFITLRSFMQISFKGKPKHARLGLQILDLSYCSF